MLLTPSPPVVPRRYLFSFVLVTTLCVSAASMASFNLFLVALYILTFGLPFLCFVVIAAYALFTLSMHKKQKMIFQHSTR
jgi:fucose permease